MEIGVVLKIPPGAQGFLRSSSRIIFQSSKFARSNARMNRETLMKSSTILLHKIRRLRLGASKLSVFTITALSSSCVVHFSGSSCLGLRFREHETIKIIPHTTLEIICHTFGHDQQRIDGPNSRNLGQKTVMWCLLLGWLIRGLWIYAYIVNLS